jgi:hypothetical protein
MTFVGLSSFDTPAIARAEQARRLAAMRNMQGITVAQRRTDAAEWAAIVEWENWFAAGRKGFLPGDGLEEAEYLYRVILDIARAAMADWVAKGRASGEAEARPFLLYALATRWASLAGEPRPTIDPRTGELAAPNPERKAA